jgi:hypothetical protein
MFTFASFYFISCQFVLPFVQLVVSDRLLNMKRVIVYGGQGGLGQVLVSHLKGKGYWIVSGKHIKYSVLGRVS